MVNKGLEQYLSEIKKVVYLFHVWVDRENNLKKHRKLLYMFKAPSLLQGKCGVYNEVTKE